MVRGEFSIWCLFGVSRILGLGLDVSCSKVTQDTCLQGPRVESLSVRLIVGSVGRGAASPLGGRTPRGAAMLTRKNCFFYLPLLPRFRHIKILRICQSSGKASGPAVARAAVTTIWRAVWSKSTKLKVWDSTCCSHACSTFVSHLTCALVCCEFLRHRCLWPPSLRLRRSWRSDVRSLPVPSQTWSIAVS